MFVIKFLHAEHFPRCIIVLVWQRINYFEKIKMTDFLAGGWEVGDLRGGEGGGGGVLVPSRWKVTQIQANIN